MGYILNIETATTVCSVSLSQGEKLLFCKELNKGFTHAENLHLFIDQALKETGVTSKQLNAIAVSKGPGSYTGLRIGVSAAKGLAYALNIPLISLDTLQIMAASTVSQQKEQIMYCPMIDARRMEVYTAVYDAKLQVKIPVESLIIDEFSIQKFKAYPKICYFGDGMSKCRELLNLNENAVFIEKIYPSARYMPELAHEKFQNLDFENLAYFEPFYLKDFLIREKKSRP
jgi:tRNA threonylcarbamoyladenosine biosynthesis protein TsaB